MKVNYDNFKHTEILAQNGDIISICSARCCNCSDYFEEVNNFPPYIHYKKCPHCGVDLEVDEE